MDCGLMFGKSNDGKYTLVGYIVFGFTGDLNKRRS